MKKLLSVGLFLGLLWLTASTVGAQTGKANFATKKKNGYTLNISFTVRNGKLSEVSFSEWRPVNQSFHECGVEGKRGDGQTTWTERGNTLVVDQEGTSLTIIKRGTGYLVKANCSAMQVFFTKVGAKYVGKMLG